MRAGSAPLLTAGRPARSPALPALPVLLLVLLVWGAAAGTPADPLAGPVPDADEPLPAEDLATLTEVLGDPVFLAHGDFTRLDGGSDIRTAWVLADLLRFHQASPRAGEVQAALARVAGLPDDATWVDASDALLVADVPAFPGYLELKATQYLSFEPDWAPFLVEASDVDPRLVTWGGVTRDGISTLDDPALVGADEGWIGGDEEVFGVVVDGEARAYPRRVMEVHELVNDTLGGRRIAVPYCTLCGTAAAYDTTGLLEDGGDGEMRTSGLLQRSNKLMYEVATESLFDSFAGVGLAGALRGVALPRVAVTATSWDAWRTAHPGTTIVARDATDRRYDADPLGGRDDDGPIFPVGTIDPRLDAQERVIGVVVDGQAVAFPEVAALRALDAGDPVEVAGLSLVQVDGVWTVRPIDGGPPVPTLVAFWFAWSQFNADTLLWQP